MKEEGYLIRNPYENHFVTFRVVDWVDVFTRCVYRDIILKSFSHCRKEKGLRVHAYVIMSNHVHAILSAVHGGLPGVIASFKKYTGLHIIKETAKPGESRSEWMLKRFEFAAIRHQRNSEHQFWEHDNHPIEIYSQDFLLQKMQYIHNNPVRNGLVDEPEHYLYSPARNYSRGIAIMEIDILDV